jgi:hypothetical protein
VRLHPGVASGNLGVELEALSMGGEKQSDMPRREPVRRVAVECGEISAYARHMVSISAPVDRYTVSVDEYVRFRSEGFLIVRGLVATDEVQELLSHVDYLLTGRVEVPGAPAFGADNKTAETRLDHLLRIHMLHRRLEIHERFMLHPRVLDVVQAFGGPDVLALQTMLFVKRPGSAARATTRTPYTSSRSPTRSSAPGSHSTRPTRRTAASGSPQDRSTSPSIRTSTSRPVTGETASSPTFHRSPAPTTRTNAATS